MTDLHFDADDQALWDEYLDRGRRIAADKMNDFPTQATGDLSAWLRLFDYVETMEHIAEHPELLSLVEAGLRLFDGEILDRKSKETLASTDQMQ